MAGSLSKGINGAVSQITAVEVLLLAYPAIILLSSLLTSVVLYLVRRDTRGVLDGQDVTIQYMEDNTGEVVKEEEEERQVGQIMGLFL